MTHVNVKAVRISEHDPRININAGRLGRHIEHDPRSKDFRVWVTGVGVATVHHRRYGGPLDQGNLSSCTGNAAAGIVNTSPVHPKSSHLLKEDDAVELYKRATVLDEFDGEYPPDDTGSSGLAVAKAAVEKGYITSYLHAFGINEALMALQTNPVITGVNWYEGFDSPNPNTGLVEVSGQVRGGHEFEVIGYDAHKQMVYAINSWGWNWGLRGRFCFSVSVWERLLSEDGDVTVLVK